MDARAKLQAARLVAYERAPYMRSALLALVPVEWAGAPEVGASLAVTRDMLLLVHYDGIKGWTVPQIAGGLVHECWHVLRQHAERHDALDRAQHGALDSAEWNRAADLEINDDLQAGRWELPEGALYPHRYGLPDGQTAEEYLRALGQAHSNAKPAPQAATPPQKPNARQTPAQGPSAGNGKQQTDEAPTPSVGSGACGSCSGHALPGEPQGEERAQLARSEVEIQRIRKQVAEEIRKATDGRGGISAGMARWAEQATKPPRVPWQQRLAVLARASIAERAGCVDYRYSRPSRRQAGVGFGAGRPVLPAMRAPRPHVALVADTSGSMGSAELAAVVREGRGILAAAGAPVTFLSNDADVTGTRTARTATDIARAMSGGGGTDFRPPFRALAKAKRRPDVVIYVTDGIGPAPIAPPAGMRVIWVLVGPHRRKPWGVPDSSGAFAGGEPIGWGSFVEVDDDGRTVLDGNA